MPTFLSVSAPTLHSRTNTPNRTSRPAQVYKVVGGFKFNGGLRRSGWLNGISKAWGAKETFWYKWNVVLILSYVLRTSWRMWHCGRICILEYATTVNQSTSSSYQKSPPTATQTPSLGPQRSTSIPKSHTPSRTLLLIPRHTLRCIQCLRIRILLLLLLLSFLRT